MAMVDAGRYVYGGGAVATGEFLIRLSSSLLLLDSSSDMFEEAFSGSSKGGNSSFTGDGSLVSWRTSSKSYVSKVEIDGLGSFL